jgi:hypothetical protein
MVSAANGTAPSPFTEQQLQDLRAKYARLFADYKLTVTGLYLCDRNLAGLAPVFPESLPGGFKAAEEAPVDAFLRVPRLDPDVERLLREKDTAPRGPGPQ